jgi:hypothetical protein
MKKHVIHESRLYRPDRAPAMVAVPPDRFTGIEASTRAIAWDMELNGSRVRPLRL